MNNKLSFRNTIRHIQWLRQFRKLWFIGDCEEWAFYWGTLAISQSNKHSPWRLLDLRWKPAKNSSDEPVHKRLCNAPDEFVVYSSLPAWRHILLIRRHCSLHDTGKYLDQIDSPREYAEFHSKSWKKGIWSILHAQSIWTEHSGMLHFSLTGVSNL